jgi:hypothetical protein
VRKKYYNTTSKDSDQRREEAKEMCPNKPAALKAVGLFEHY